MKRRDFIRKSAAVSIASGALFTMGEWRTVLAAESSQSGLYDMVAVKNGSPITMFNAGIAALGGMKKFVKPGQSVVINPNIGWDSAPERAANTNPDLIGQIVKQCFQAGAKKVTVFDNTCDEWTRCYKNSGIERAVKDNGGYMISGKDDGMYREIDVPKGEILKKVKVHELVLDSDVYINVPVLKDHGSTHLSVALKNMMGVVWGRRWWHAKGLHQCIADFATVCMPTLNIVDGYRVIKRNGPRGVSVADVAEMKYQLISTNIVAVDTAAAKIFGVEHTQIKYIGLAEAAGMGTTNLKSLNIKRISL